MSLIKHTSQVILRGGLGESPVPPFAFDLMGDSVDRSKNGGGGGLLRYGKNPDAVRFDPKDKDINKRDKRPLAPSYYLKPRIGGLTPTDNSLITVNDPFRVGRDDMVGYNYIDSTPNKFKQFEAGSLAAGQSINFSAYIFKVPKPKKVAGQPKPKAKKGNIWFLTIGDEKGGINFQIRDDNAEIMRFSDKWNADDEARLWYLWSLTEATGTEDEEIETLKLKLYKDFESLSLGRTLGGAKWRNSPFSITLVPEPRGALHVILEGADATMIEFKDLIEEDDPAPLWGDGAIVSVGSTGGAWIFLPQDVLFNKPKLIFGPYKSPFGSDDWDRVIFDAQAGAYKNDPSIVNGNTPLFKSKVLFTKEDINEVAFQFKVEFTSTSPFYCAWLYSLSARLPNSARVQDDEVYFDTANLYKPVSSDENPKSEDNPIMKIALSLEEGGIKKAEVMFRDVKGLTSSPANVDALLHRTGSLKIDGQFYFKDCIVSRAKVSDLARNAQNGQRQGIRIAKNATTFSLSLDEGYQTLKETLLTYPPVGDGKRLGKQIWDLLREAGYSDAELIGINVNLGPILDKAKAGKSWANCPSKSTSVLSAVDSLLDRYGLGLRFYRTKLGVWTLENVPTDIKVEYTSDHSQNKNDARNIILSPLDWERDPTNFFNCFRVEGDYKKNGDLLSANYVDKRSIKGAQAGYPKWLGREKRYPTLIDSGMRTDASINYAIRSLNFRFGKLSNVVQFQTYSDLSLEYLDRITIDGVLAEILSWTAEISSGEGSDKMMIRAREVV